MQFTLTSALLLAASTLGLALPTAVEKRAAAAVPASSMVKLYEHSPDKAFGPSTQGEASRVDPGNTGVKTLVSFELGAGWGGATCNLRFGETLFPPSGSKTFALYDFTPANGVTFDANKASWNSRTGWTNSQLAVYKVGEGNSLVYSFPCPADGKTLNYEVASSNGATNIQWAAEGTKGLWLEVLSPGVVAKRQSGTRIPLADQCKIFEQFPDSAAGSIQFGEASQSGSGRLIATLIGFVMPAEDLTSRTCALHLVNPTAATGSKSFTLFEFVPNGDRAIFDSTKASFNSRTGFRNRELTVFKVGQNSNPVYRFPCPAPNKGVNFEVAPTNGDSKVTWTTANGGFELYAQ